jgi:flagellar biosynthesis chaperone FliJ
MAKIVYPLLQVLEVKKKRVEDQERVVQEKKNILEKEQEKLKEREAERDKAKEHHAMKLQQLRDELDQGTNTAKIMQMKAYLKVALEKVKVEEKKVKEQRDQVELAEKALEEARHDLKLRRLEVDKLETHREDWEREMRKEMDIIEGREQDELGSTIYTTNQNRRKSLKMR